MGDVALVLLAAGGASRMGAAKQLLEVGGEPMVRRAARLAQGSRCRPRIVVVGAERERVRLALGGLDVDIVVHEGWERGIGTSIRAGVSRALESRADGVLIALADQPFVDSAALDRLVERFDGGDVLAVASSYGDTVGVPALFARSLSGRLVDLPDEEGCRRLLAELGRVHPEKLAVVPCAAAACDVDTRADLRLVRRTLQDPLRRVRPA